MSQAEKSETATLADYFQDLEIEAVDLWSLRTLRLVDQSGISRGLCLLDGDMGQKKLERLIAEFASCRELRSMADCTANQAPEEISPTISDSSNSPSPFRAELELAFAGAMLSRLPLTLLLLEFQGKGSVNDDLFAEIDHLLVPDTKFHLYDDRVLNAALQNSKVWVMVMPALGLVKARNMALRILAILNSASGNQQYLTDKGFSMGLGIAYGGSAQTINDLLRMAEDNLVKGRELSDRLGWGQSSSKEESCQVTAAERACLFGLKP